MRVWGPGFSASGSLSGFRFVGAKGLGLLVWGSQGDPAGPLQVGGGGGGPSQLQDAVHAASPPADHTRLHLPSIEFKYQDLGFIRV